VSTVINVPKATETQLLQLNTIMQLAGEASEVARFEISNPPPPLGTGRPDTWSRIPGVASRMAAAVAIYNKLGGPALPAAVDSFIREAPQLPTKPTVIVGQAQAVLATLTNFAENIEAA
jgi:hypothetical protein